MSANDEEHSESEFYYSTEDVTFPSIDRNEVLAPSRAVEGQICLTSPEELGEVRQHEKIFPDNTKKKTMYDINVV
jgi:hypothetical protein